MAINSTTSTKWTKPGNTQIPEDPQGETDDPSRPQSIKEIKYAVNNLSQRKPQARWRQRAILPNIQGRHINSKRTPPGNEEGNVPTSFFKAILPLTPKPDKERNQ